jgi:hypothetical protein
MHRCHFEFSSFPCRLLYGARRLARLLLFPKPSAYIMQADLVAIPQQIRHLLDS